MVWRVSMCWFPISMELYIWFVLKVGPDVIWFWWDIDIFLIVYIPYSLFWTITYTIYESKLSYYISFPLRKYHWIYAFEYEALHIYYRTNNHIKWYKMKYNIILHTLFDKLVGSHRNSRAIFAHTVGGITPPITSNFTIFQCSQI